MPTPDDFPAQRAKLVARHLAARGIHDPSVLRAMGSVRRELFVPEALRSEAYHDGPIPIGSGQTISQPYIVAVMIEALQLTGGETVLEIGAGCGYAAAVLSEIAGRVFAIERIPSLADLARANLAAAGHHNVEVRTADGTAGWPEAAPFDAILVSAGAPEEPPALLHQLQIGGRLVVPIGATPTEQELWRITRTGPDTFVRNPLGGVRFVPLIGRQGWPEDQQS